MAAPNIVGVTTITGITTAKSIDTSSEVVIVSNAADSGYLYKINQIIVTNVSGTTTAHMSLTYYDGDNGSGTDNYKLANNIGIATASSLIVLDKASAIYLEEDKSITFSTPNANVFDVVCSYEQIED